VLIYIFICKFLGTQSWHTTIYLFYPAYPLIYFISSSFSFSPEKEPMPSIYSKIKMLSFSSKMAAVNRVMSLCYRQFHLVFLPRARIQARQIRITYQRGEILRQEDRILAGGDARLYKGGGFDHSGQSEGERDWDDRSSLSHAVLGLLLRFFGRKVRSPAAMFSNGDPLDSSIDALYR
jgi:hypothetical protein